MAGSRLTFDVLAKDRASSTFSKVGRSSDNLGRKFGFLSTRTRRLSAGMRVGFGLVASAMGGIATISVFKSFIKEARDSQKVSRITASVIKSTGGAAKVTARHVDNLSERLAEQSAVDDELVQTGANLLLTFKKVRNEIGEGNKILDRATAAAVDLSAVGFGSVESASKMMGKALNDPIKGLTALSRAGVTFTEKQKKQIKTLVETGDVLAAQKIILKEVESQVGGAAKAAADPIAKLSVVVNNLKERLGTALLPAISTAADWLSDKLPGAVSIVLEAFRGLRKFIKDKVAPILEKFFEKIDISAFVDKGKDLFDAAKAWGTEVIDGIIEGFKTGDWTGLGETIATLLKDAITAAIDLGAMLLDLFGKVDWFNVGKAVGRQAASFALGFISELVNGLIDAAIKHPVDFGLAIVSALGVGAIGGKIASVLRKIPFARALAPIFEGLNKLTGPLNRAIGRVAAIFGSGFKQGFAKHFPGVYSALRRRLEDAILNILIFVERFVNAGRSLIRGLGRGIGSLLGWVVRRLAGLPKQLINFFKNAGSWLFSAGANLISGFISGIKSKIGEVLTTIADVASKVRDYLPFSPAKKGPLSGRGNPFYSGQSIGRLLSKGMVASRGEVVTSAAALAGAARVNGSASMTAGVNGGGILPGGAGAKTGVVFTGDIHVHGVQNVRELVEQIQRYARRNAGVKVRTFA